MIAVTQKYYLKENLVLWGFDSNFSIDIHRIKIPESKSWGQNRSVIQT